MGNNDIQGLYDYVVKLGRRIDAIEKQLGISTTTQPPPNLSSDSSPDKLEQSKPSPQRPPTPHKPYQPKNNPNNSTDNAKLLGGVGVFCFLLAASYFIKLAIDQGWLTPFRQLTCAGLFGLSLIAGGFKLREQDAKYASLLPGAGVVVLFMTAYAGHLYFHLYDFIVASLLVDVISVCSIILYIQFQHNFYALAAICGTYLVPTLIGIPASAGFSTAMYYIFWDVTYCVIAVMLKNRQFIAFAAYLAILTFNFHVWSHRIGHESELNFSGYFQFIQFLLFSIATAWYTTKSKIPLLKEEAWALFPVLLIFYFIEYDVIQRLNSEVAPWCALGFAAVVYGVYFTATKILKKTELESFPMVAAFLSIVTFHALYLDLLPSSITPLFAIILFASTPLLRKLGITYQRCWLAYVILGAIVICEYLHALNFHSWKDPSISQVAINILFGVLLFLAYASHKAKSLFVLMLGSLQILVGLRHIAELTFTGATNNYFTSGLWGLFAFGLLVIAKSTLDRTLAHGALILFTIVALKVFFSDISMDSPIARIISLLAIGGLFYAGGFIYRQVESWSKD